MRKINSVRSGDTAISPVPLALKHFLTLPIEYQSEPDDLKREEEPKQHEPKLHADRMIPPKILPPLSYPPVTLTTPVILVQKLYVASAMKDNHLHKDDRYHSG